MNPFVADPEWGWWITLYFFLGGIAAGAYFVATLIELFGHEEDVPLARIGYRIAFPLICLCGIFLTVDLERPERFWHMMFQSERVHEALDAGWPLGGWGDMVQAPILKWWSPMSIGAWALAVFGAWSFLSFLTAIWPTGFLARTLHRHWLGHGFRLIGSGVGFFIASYTGVLLSATNQPLWSLSDWIAPLFLTSAASTAIAVLLLLGRGISPESRHRLERADLWALGLELFLFLIFLASLGGLLPLVLQTWQGWVLVAGTLVVGILKPLALHFFLGRLGSARVTLAAVFALIGGFLLRWGIVTIGPALLHVLERRHQHGDSLDFLHAPLMTSLAGAVLIAVTVVLAVAIPLLLRKEWRLSGQWTGAAGLVSVLVVAGVLFYSTRPAEPTVSLLKMSPEEGRTGAFGASFFNRPKTPYLRTKIEKEPEP
jgi:formate-dependent nitrite reductase membrane component NrfD